MNKMNEINTMLSNPTIMLMVVAAAALLLGWLLGWLLTRSSFSRRAKLLQAGLDEQAGEATKQQTINEELKAQLAAMQQQAGENADEKLSLQTSLEEQLQRLKEMMAERDRLNELIDSLSHERSDARELVAALKTRNDETQRLVIDQRNDYLRLKAQSELWPVEREKLQQEITLLKTAADRSGFVKS